MVNDVIVESFIVEEDVVYLSHVLAQNPGCGSMGYLQHDSPGGAERSSLHFLPWVPGSARPQSL
jgi:hypothetical protein